MTDIQHKDITGSDAIHPADFYQNSDPGAVGPNKSWLDTSVSPPIQKRRNASDTGWDTVLDPSLYQAKSLLTTLGDMAYATAGSVWARLAGNTTSTKKFLRMTGTGAAAAAPAWDTLVAGDIPTLDASKVGTGTLSTSRIPSLESGYWMSHVNGGGGLDIWYMLGVMNQTGSTTAAVAANTLYATPFIATARLATIDRLAFNVTGAIAGNGRLGIYNVTSSTNIYPGSLFTDVGAISTSTTGVKAATTGITLTPGQLYWAVYLGDAAATLRVYNSQQLGQLVGIDSSLGVNPNRGLTVAQTYGALPATFPAGAVTTIASILPVVYVRYSA